MLVTTVYLLRAVIRASLEAGATVCRQGGEEFFAVLAAGSDIHTVSEVVRKLDEFGQQPFTMRGGSSLLITVTVGYSPLGPGVTVRDALRAAENHLGACKGARGARTIKILKSP